MNAGCVFKNDTHILAGYQPRKRCINGIGGKPEEGEDSHRTAVREMLEEVFGVCSDELIQAVYQIPYSEKIEKKSYTMYIYSFEDLENICKIVKDSPFYTMIPETVWELVIKRVAITAEISHLCILPLVEHDKKLPFVEPYFVGDIQAIR